MSLIRLIAAVALIFSGNALASGEIDLSQHIAAGKWAFAYARMGEFKPLHYRKKENGTSHTCIRGNARQTIVAWVTEKGCTISRESFTGGVYRLEGQCRLSWWKSHPIPVGIELRPETRARFSLTIRTRDDAILAFSERTTATLLGPCDPVSAGQPGQHQQAQR